MEVVIETVDRQYVNLIRDCLENGDSITTRNSAVKRVFGKTLTFDSTPLVGVRKTAWKLALREWEWFMSGSSHIDDLHPSVRHWWEPWVGKEKKVHNNYSEQLRAFSGSDLVVDQVELLLDGVKNHPYSRRNLITTWNTADMVDVKTAITNCHSTVIQAFVGEDGLLSLVTYQRSCDVVCGLPHNLIQMAAFHLWLAARTGRRIGKLVWVGGDVHVYSQHYELAEKMVASVDQCKPTPTLTYTPTGEEFKAEGFSLEGEYGPVLMDKAEMVI